MQKKNNVVYLRTTLKLIPMRRLLFNILFLSSFAVAMADRVPENVVISDAKEVYTFVETPFGVRVQAVEQTQYEATRHSAVVVPHAFYNNKISLDKVSGGKAEHKIANSPNVFHDDSRVCFFKADLKAKGSKAKAEFRRTFLDGAFFAKLSLSGVYPIKSKTVRFEIPAACSSIELSERNFPEGKIIRTDTDNPDGSRTVMFEINDLPEICDDKASPEPVDCEPYIIVKGYFKGLDDLYEYHRRMLDVDTVIPGVADVIKEASAGAVDRSEIIRNIYKYVQQKTRYVAYEEGEAGYRPDQPAEVLRKQYGDCKGMSLLLATLLNRAGVEAYIASVGTRHIPFRIAECPSLSATNHMICIVPSDSETLFLDATCEYISSTDIPGSIQGKDAMMYTATGYEMVDIPVLPPERSSEISVCEYEIADGKLRAKSRHSYTGDMLEMALTTLNGMNRSYKGDVLALMVKTKKNIKIDKESITHGYANDDEYQITASFVDEYGVTDAGDAVYVDLSSQTESFVDRVDLSNRRNDLRLPFRSQMVRRSVLEIPDGYGVGDLPSDYHGECCGVKFDCRFLIDDFNRVFVERSVVIDATRVPRGRLEDWNRVVSAWMEAAGQQIELRKL